MLIALVGALVAGALTTLAPCSLTLLPVVLGGSLQGADSQHPTRRAMTIVAALAASVVAFTLMLRATTALLAVPDAAWRWLSGGLLVLLGAASLWPGLWDRVAIGSGLNAASARGLARARGRSGLVGAALTGAALGPVFTSCSPLYAYVVVTVLPAEFGRGMALLLAYVVGLAAVLLLIALLGQRALRRLRWALDPESVARRVIGALFIVLGVLIITGLMRSIETWILDHVWLDAWSWGASWGAPLG